jgi:hypothetical protein
LWEGNGFKRCDSGQFGHTKLRMLMEKQKKQKTKNKKSHKFCHDRYAIRTVPSPTQVQTLHLH